MSSNDLPAPPPSAEYYPDEVILYGAKLNSGAQGDIRYTSSARTFILHLELRDGGGAPLTTGAVAMALVYGYSVDGHCYRVDRPRLLLFTDVAEAPALGCGFGDGEPSGGSGYHMWRVRRSTEVYELGGLTGRIDDLLLQSNSPGRRSPASYSVHAQLAHRTSRLPSGEGGH